MAFFRSTTLFFTEAKRRNRLLFHLALALSFLFLIFMAAFGICGNPPIAEICYWIKPFKFSLSFAIYVLTLGWLMEYLKPSVGEKKLKRASIWIASWIIIEMTVIFLQSLLHSETYANLHLSDKSTQLIGSILHMSGNIGILINTAVAAYIAVHFFKNIPIKPESYLWGIRAGFTIFIFSCFLGIFLLLYYGQMPPDQKHFGFPFTQLSSTRNNLISLHFFGIHALQLFPLIGFYLTNKIASFAISTLCFLYFGGTFFFLTQLT